MRKVIDSDVVDTPARTAIHNAPEIGRDTRDISNGVQQPAPPHHRACLGETLAPMERIFAHDEPAATARQPRADAGGV